MSQNLPKTRKEALELGAKHYFTGKPCKRGHVARRFASTRQCMNCQCHHSLNQYYSDKEGASKKAKKWRESNPDYGANWRRENSDLCKEYLRNGYNKYGSFYVMRRKAAKLQRTPAWANLEAIKRVYQDCPTDHQVDHIVPLQGELVSGLHVENNLQYLSQSENASKGNRWNPTIEVFLDGNRRSMAAGTN